MTSEDMARERHGLSPASGATGLRKERDMTEETAASFETTGIGAQPAPALDLSEEEIATLIASEGEAAQDLRRRADEVRAATVGDEVFLRGIVEFSSHCRCHCQYCGLRADNEELDRYRLSPEEIVAAAETIAELGLGTVVLQSGEDEWWTAEELAQVIAAIRSRTPLAVTLSVGEREAWEYRLWHQAGADRYLLKQETIDPELYAEMHPGAERENRIRCLETLREIGYQVGSGCLVGLPGQTPAMLARELVFMKDLGVHMAGIGPLVPHPHTPLADLPSGSAEKTLNMMALLRLLVPDVMLAATTALETLMPGGRLAALRSGANVIMPNITPRQYAASYEIYPGKKAPGIAVTAEVERVRQVIQEAGRVASSGPGHSPRLSGAHRQA